MNLLITASVLLVSASVPCFAQNTATQRVDVPVKGDASLTTIVRVGPLEIWDKTSKPQFTRLGYFQKIDSRLEVGGYIAFRKPGQIMFNPSVILRQSVAGGNTAVWLEPYVGLNQKSPWIFSIPEARLLFPIDKHLSIGPGGYAWFEEKKLATMRLGVSAIAKSGDVTGYARITPFGSDRGLWGRFQITLAVK